MGSVTLLGAGCSSELITLQGINRIRNAEVIVYDDLLDERVLEHRSEDCELIYVGKRAGKHSKNQEEINRILVEKAGEGKRVLRLKGGDSFVFGRGGEEVLYLQAAGIPCEVLPGICSGIAVPEHLGIPVTHRGAAQSVTFVTGHSADDTSESFEALGKLKGTIVFFMGLSAAGEISRRLIENGKSADTPAAILCEGYRDGERRIDGTLEELADMAEMATTPALILVGQTASLHLESTIEQPLAGKSVTVVGTKVFTQKLCERLSREGARVTTLPVITVKPNEDALSENFEGYTWAVFTSSNGIRIFFDLMKQSGRDIREMLHLKFACIGSGTADTLKKYGILPDLIPQEYTAQHLGEALAKKTDKDDRLLILRAENGSQKLNEELDRAGIDYLDKKIYHTCERTALTGGVIGTDYLVFGSSFGRRTFEKHYKVSEKTKIVCIGEETAEGMTESSQVLIARTHTADGICTLLMENARCKENQLADNG